MRFFLHSRGTGQRTRDGWPFQHWRNPGGILSLSFSLSLGFFFTMSARFRLCTTLSSPCLFSNKLIFPFSLEILCFTKEKYREDRCFLSFTKVRVSICVEFFTFDPFQIQRVVKQEFRNRKLPAVIRRKLLNNCSQTITEWYITLYTPSQRLPIATGQFYILHMSRESSRREELVRANSSNSHEAAHFIVLDNLFHLANALSSRTCVWNTPGGEAVTEFRQPDYPLIRLDDSYRPSRTCEMDLSINPPEAVRFYARALKWKTRRGRKNRKFVERFSFSFSSFAERPRSVKKEKKVHRIVKESMEFWENFFGTMRNFRRNCRTLQSCMKFYVILKSFTKFRWIL